MQIFHVCCTLTSNCWFLLAWKDTQPTVLQLFLKYSVEIYKRPMHQNSKLDINSAGIHVGCKYYGLHWYSTHKIFQILHSGATGLCWSGMYIIKVWMKKLMMFVSPQLGYWDFFGRGRMYYNIDIGINWPWPQAVMLAEKEGAWYKITVIYILIISIVVQALNPVRQMLTVGWYHAKLTEVKVHCKHSTLQDKI